jgi:hypothetical protein
METKGPLNSWQESVVVRAFAYSKRATKALCLSSTFHAEWGDWRGNDTIWRTILDTNRVLFYADRSGVLRETKQRNYFCFIDGVVGMEGEGPMAGDAVPAGVVLAGDDPVAVDARAAEVMGFDSGKVQTIKAAGGLPQHGLGLSDLSQGRLSDDGGATREYTFSLPAVARVDRPLGTSLGRPEDAVQIAEGRTC